LKRGYLARPPDCVGHSRLRTGHRRRGLLSRVRVNPSSLLASCKKPNLTSGNSRVLTRHAKRLLLRAQSRTRRARYSSPCCDIYCRPSGPKPLAGEEGQRPRGEPLKVRPWAGVMGLCHWGPLALTSGLRTRRSAGWSIRTAAERNRTLGRRGPLAVTRSGAPVSLVVLPGAAWGRHPDLLPGSPGRWRYVETIASEFGQ